MKKMLFLALGAAMALTACNNQEEQQTAKATDAEEANTGLRIAYVEVDTLMNQYQFCRDYNLVLNKKAENIQNTLAEKQRALQQHYAAMQKKYESNGFTTRDELERAQNSLQKEQQNLAELEQRLGNELAAENAKLTEEMRDSIQMFLKTYNKSKKYDFILTKQGDNILLANAKYDITNQVVAGLNKRYKAKPDVKKATEKKTEKKD
ncbi:MAG: OmpH family outer membrane protein [Bacteroidaceae bacterium]|nr:OmpH family outer membrane protein [Bacteroidaceae bacterium]